MKWKGTVSQLANQKIAIRLSAEKTAQPSSSTCGLYGHLSATTRAAARRMPVRRREPPARLAASPGDELIALTPHCLDQVEAEFGTQPPDTHVHDVGARVEVIAPDGGQQLALRHGLADMLGELAEQQELEPGQRHRAVADVRHEPPDVERDVARPDHLGVRVRVGVRQGLAAWPG